MNKDLKLLHAGCGTIYHEGWINLDINDTHKVDIKADILQTHFDENSFDAIYSCHSFEHLRFPEDAVEALTRYYRWLKPGGVLRISVPSLEIAVKAYVGGSSLKFLLGEDFKGYYHKDMPGDRLNYFIKAFDHQVCYDFPLLSSMFADAGFVDIRNRQPNESLIPGFCHDRFIGGTIYIEATK